MEIVGGQNNSRATLADHCLRETGAELHIDVLSSRRHVRSEQSFPLLFRTRELSAPPRRAAGDDDRLPTTGERSHGIRITDRVETQLDEIRRDDSIALPAEFRR